MKRLAPLLILTILFAACTPQPAPTATPVPPTATPPPTETAVPTATIAPIALEARTMEFPAPGTLVVRSVGNTQTAPQTFTFETIEFAVSGGRTGSVLMITLDFEGNVTRNEVESTVPPETVEEIRAALEAINFYGFQGNFSALADSETRSYTLRVAGSLGARTIRALERLTPPELQAIFDMLTALGV